MFPKVYHLNMMFEENFLRLILTVRLQKRGFSYYFFQSVIITLLSQNKFTFLPDF